MEVSRERWLPTAELFLPLAAGLAWFVSAGELSWQPLMIALLPWIIRLGASQPSLTRSPLDPFLLIFLLSGCIGVWAAYDRSLAWCKFWTILGAVLVFYGLARQRYQNTRIAAGALTIVGVVVSGYFLLTHDWQTWPADFNVLTRIGLELMTIRPNPWSPRIHPNIAGGLMAVMAPFALALGLYAQRMRLSLLRWLSFLAMIVILIGLLLTSSRAAWLALTLALGIWLLWDLNQRLMSFVSRLRRIALFTLGFVLVSSVGLWLLASVPGGLESVISDVPGPDNSTSRIELVKDTMRLVGDYPLTGGGLNSFAGLYSNYIAVIPFFQFSYSHNFYLDVMLEQGVIGFLSMTAILIGAAWFLVSALVSANHDEVPGRRILTKRTVADGTNLFRAATAVGLVTMAIHGFADDALYGGYGTAFLFVLPGMAAAVFDPALAGDGQLEQGLFRRGFYPLVAVSLIVVVLGFVLGYGRALVATWHANLGAVEMGRVELAGWPTGKWDDGSRVDDLGQAADRFEQALRLNPGERTAHHRLGLIAMLKQDFDAAVTHLEVAHRLDDEHRGILKALGYSYVWADDLTKATRTLAGIPEARDELDVYSRWWSIHGRDDLAARAERMVGQLD